MKATGLALVVGALCVLLPAAGWSQPRGRAGARPRALTSDTVGAAEPGPGFTPPSSLEIDGNLSLGGNVYKVGDRLLFTDLYYGNQSLGGAALSSVTPTGPFDGTWNSAFGGSTLASNTVGWSNTATGYLSLLNNTSGYRNTAAGSFSLVYNSTGYSNTALGNTVLYYNTVGNRNTAAGTLSFFYNTTGSANVAIGFLSGLFNNDGNRNTFIGGLSSFFNSSGSDNAAIGFGAGYNNTSGNSNVFINNIGVYPGTESNTLRIGDGTGSGQRQLTRAFISGIANAAGVFSQGVCIDTMTDQLGPCGESSARFKEDIEDLGDASEAVFDLRPVKFRYRVDFAGEPEQPLRYGLIAEEVAEIFPNLVTYDAEDRPVTVRYEALTPLLLNELRKERARNASQETRLAEQEAELAALRADRVRLDELTARLARLEALEGRREEPAVVARR